MNASTPLYLVVAFLVIGIAVGFAIFRPNTVRGWFGMDTGPGSEPELQVLREKLKARADNIADEMAAVAKDYDRLEKDIAPLRRPLGELMRHPKLRNTEWAELWKEAAQRPDKELLAEFTALAKQVGVAKRDLEADGNPKVWEPILDDGRKKAKVLADDTQRRRDALDQIKQKFVESEE
jgi:hypothetical protein